MSTHQYKMRLLNALNNSLDGLKTVWKNEQAFRWEVYLSLVLMPVIFYISVSNMLKLLLILLLLLLFVVEIINSALETVVDRISLERHEKSKNAKDMGSLAVLMVIIMNVVAWIYTIYEYLI